MVKTPLMRLIELQRGRTIEDLLTERVKAGMPWTEIARDLDIPYATLNDWRRSLGVGIIRTLSFGPKEAIR